MLFRFFLRGRSVHPLPLSFIGARGAPDTPAAVPQLRAWPRKGARGNGRGVGGLAPTARRQRRRDSVLDLSTRANATADGFYFAPAWRCPTGPGGGLAVRRRPQIHIWGVCPQSVDPLHSAGTTPPLLDGVAVAAVEADHDRHDMAEAPTERGEASSPPCASAVCARTPSRRRAAAPPTPRNATRAGGPCPPPLIALAVASVHLPGAPRALPCWVTPGVPFCRFGQPEGAGRHGGRGHRVRSGGVLCNHPWTVTKSCRFRWIVATSCHRPSPAPACGKWRRARQPPRTATCRCLERRPLSGGKCRRPRQRRVGGDQLDRLGGGGGQTRVARQEFDSHRLSVERLPSAHGWARCPANSRRGLLCADRRQQATQYRSVRGHGAPCVRWGTEGRWRAVETTVCICGHHDARTRRLHINCGAHEMPAGGSGGGGGLQTANHGAGGAVVRPPTCLSAGICRRGLSDHSTPSHLPTHRLKTGSLILA